MEGPPLGESLSLSLKNMVPGKLILISGTDDEVCLRGTQGHTGGDWWWSWGVGGQNVVQERLVCHVHVHVHPLED